MNASRDPGRSDDLTDQELDALLARARANLLDHLGGSGALSPALRPIMADGPEGHDFESFFSSEGASLWAAIVVAAAGIRDADPDDIWLETMARAAGRWAEIRRPKAWCRIVATRLLCGAISGQPATSAPGPRFEGEAQAMLDLLRTLPHRERVTLALSCTPGGMTGHEIATALDCKLPRVYVLRPQAQRRLARALKRRDVDGSIHDLLAELAAAFATEHPGEEEVLVRIRSRMTSHHPKPWLVLVAERQRRLLDEPVFKSGAVPRGTSRAEMAEAMGTVLADRPGADITWLLRVHDALAFRRYLRRLGTMDQAERRQEVFGAYQNYLALRSYLEDEQISTGWSFSRFVALHESQAGGGSGPAPADQQWIPELIRSAPEGAQLAPLLL